MSELEDNHIPEHNHEKHHHHHHDHAAGASDKKLLFSVFLNAIITITEIVGGILSGSLALLSDSFHNLSDTASILLSYIARKISKKPKNSKYSYGYKRYETLAAFINLLFLFGVSGYLIYEGIEKLLKPAQINGTLMLWIATIGLAANGLTLILLLKDAKKSINLKAMLLHIMTDTLSSVAIIVGAILIMKYHWYMLDPIFTFAISGYILIESIEMIKEASLILLQAIPEGYDAEKIEEEIKNEFDFVNDIHSIHIWATDGNDVYLQAHVALKDNVKENKDLDYYINKLEKAFKERYKIKCCTLQLEGSRCLQG
jgi:cobalt-zinc-cadmium efflux system protein